MSLLPEEQLKEIMIKDGLIDAKTFDNISQETKRFNQDIIDVFVTRRITTQEYIAEAVSKIFGVELIKLRDREIPKNILLILPETAVHRRKAVAFDLKNGVLHVAMLNPGDFETINYLTKLTNRQIKVFTTTIDDLNWALSEYRKISVENYNKELQANVVAVNRLRQIVPERAIEEVSVISLVDNLFKYAASLNSSDIHIEPLTDSLLIRFRIDGVLQEIMRMPKELHQSILARVKVSAGIRIDEHFRPQDGRLKYDLDDLKFDVRVAVMPTFNGEKIVMRMLSATSKPLSLEELGMTNEMANVFLNNIKKTFGILLITGPTGSGKTTTIYSALTYLNKPEVNIVTIEDPIEYEIPYVNQTQVNEAANITFANGLRAFLRQDPNVIMVGEIRDEETASIAVQAALTGHLVLSTLHTNDAATSIPRLTDMKVPPYLVSASLNTSLAQRLVRKICSSCLESYEPSKETVETLKDQFNLFTGIDSKEFKIPSLFFRGRGCASCGGKGFRGRIAIFEILNIDEEIRTIIRSSDFAISKITNIARKKGFQTMFEDGIAKVGLGMTTIDEVMRVIRE